MTRTLLELTKDCYDLQEKMKVEKHKFTIITNEIDTEQKALEVQMNMIRTGIDVDTVIRAEKCLYLRGKFTGVGAQQSCLDDMSRWLSTGKFDGYRTPKTIYFGCKDYSEWVSQRDDGAYFTGPKHGTTVFAIGLAEQYHGKIEPTEQNKNDMLYYIMNITEIQKAKVMK